MTYLAIGAVLLLAAIAGGVWACFGAINHQTTVMCQLHDLRTQSMVAMIERVEGDARNGDFLPSDEDIARRMDGITQQIQKIAEGRRGWDDRDMT